MKWRIAHVLICRQKESFVEKNRIVFVHKMFQLENYQEKIKKRKKNAQVFFKPVDKSCKQEVSMVRNMLKMTLVFSVLTVGVACDKKSTAVSATEASSEESANKKYLYVSSGTCYGGGVTTSAGSATVARYDISTGALDKVIVDYNSYQPGDMPNAVINYSDTQLLVAVENASGRRIDLVNKDGSGFTTYLVNSTALNGVIRNMKLLSDGSLLVSKSTAIEKFSSGKARITQGANAYIQAPGSSCATSATLLSTMSILDNGKILFAHAAASPNNKLGLISATGYVGTSDCLGVQAAPVATALPSASLMHSTGDLLVAYGSTTAASNFVTAYDLDSTTNVFSNATESMKNDSYVYGPSAMVENTEDKSVYVANALSTFNNIEKFSYDDTTKKLTRVGSTPFVPQSVFTRCITSMSIGN